MSQCISLPQRMSGDAPGPADERSSPQTGKTTEDHCQPPFVGASPSPGANWHCVPFWGSESLGLGERKRLTLLGSVNVAGRA